MIPGTLFGLFYLELTKSATSDPVDDVRHLAKQTFDEVSNLRAAQSISTAAAPAKIQGPNNRFPKP
jgi:hypothetical protein